MILGKSHGWRSLEDCSPWGRWGSDMTERLHFHFSLSCIGERNGNPLQCSCLENPRDGASGWAAIYGVAQSRTQLKWLSSSRVNPGAKLVSPWFIRIFYKSFRMAAMVPNHSRLMSLRTWNQCQKKGANRKGIFKNMCLFGVGKGGRRGKLCQVLRALTIFMPLI